MADPLVPEPTPIPIKLITDPLPALSDISTSGVTPERRNDFFYGAWDKFLAIQVRVGIRHTLRTPVLIIT